MGRWTKANIYHRELDRLFDEGLDGREAHALALIRTEEIFGDACDYFYEQKRDREMERD